jgi:tRNA (cmo5U34)-methyltransferase
MNRIVRGFNLLAPVYDQLARGIMGREMVQSQIGFLSQLKDSKRLAILGGGTGWILNYLEKECPSLSIDYFDLSPRMVQIASGRVIKGGIKVNFIVGSVQHMPHQAYDAVMTNFFLDLFDEEQLKIVVNKISTALLPNGLWLATDFVCKNSRHAIKLWVMYRFFNVLTGIGASRLPDWEAAILLSGANLCKTKEFKKGFIVSHLYRSGNAPVKFR